MLEPLGQSQVLAYLRGLAKKGLRFRLISFEKNLFLNKKQKEALFNELSKEGIDWVALSYHKNPPILSTLFDIVYAMIVCMRIIRQDKIELVHARSYPPALIALILKKIFKLKFIFDMRGFWADERVEGKLWVKNISPYYLVKFLEKHFIKNADEIVVLTERAKGMLETWGYNIDNVSVIPCCVDTERFKFDDKSRLELRKEYNLEGKFVFVHAGSLEYWYMMEEMLNYFKIAKEVKPHAHFLILTRSDKNKILKLIYGKNLNLKDFTILSIPYVDMPKYLTMVDAGLIFITPVFSKIASSPTKFAEYLSCALPVIINDRIGDLEDYVMKNNVGVVIRDFNDNQYRQTFEDLLGFLEDKNLKLRCRQVARNNFSLNAGIDKYYQIYSKLR